jgi:hypothetical protein
MNFFFLSTTSLHFSNSGTPRLSRGECRCRVNNVIDHYTRPARRFDKDLTSFEEISTFLLHASIVTMAFL